MSIYRQFWLAIIGVTLLAFTGSFAVSVYTARKYIEQQLYMKNVDNASSLALVLSQLPSKDPVTVELIIAAQFDTGHYQEIVLNSPTHEVIAERHYTGQEADSPNWFQRLFPLQAQAGLAQVQDGWKQYGTIRVASHSRFAYQALWTGVQELAVWFVLAGLIAGVFGTLVLRLLFQPLNRVVEQAQAIQERRFITLPEPRTPELKSVVVAMNAMVGRLKSMFSEEASRLDELRRKVNHDPLTNLPNRAFFMTWLQETLQNEESLAGGTLALLRVSGLESLNSRLGHARTDQLLMDIARTLQELTEDDGHKIAARLNGSDFALLAAGDGDVGQLANALMVRLDEAVRARWQDIDDLFHIGIVPYQRGEKTSELMAATDRALAMAENMGPNRCHIAEVSGQTIQHINSEDWRAILTEALDQGRIKLERYPVLAAGGKALHEEGTARLQTKPGGMWLSAGEFMPMVLRLKLSSAVDMDAMKIALGHLADRDTEIAVNLSADSITDWAFRDALVSMLSQNPEKSHRLWIEVPEYGAFRNFDAFKSFCNSVDPLGCKLGIEHFGRHFGEIAKLAELGLDYLKVDSSYIRSISENPGNQDFLKGMCRMAHNVGILVIAEGVMTEDELDTLLGIGFDGVTGQAVTQRLQ